MCSGFQAQMEADGKGQFLLAEIEDSDGNNGKEFAKAAEKRYENNTGLWRKKMARS